MTELLDANHQPSPDDYGRLCNGASCRVYTSLKPDNPRKIKFSDFIPSLRLELENVEGFIPVEMVLQPLPTVSQVPRYYITGHELFTALAGLNRSLFRIRNRCLKQLQHPTLQRVPYLADRIKEFQRCLEKLAQEIFEKTSASLTNCRKQKENPSNLLQLCMDFWIHFFKGRDMVEWLLNRQRELVIMKCLLTDISLLVSEFQLESLTSNQPGEICFLQTDKVMDPLISKLRGYLELPQEPTSWTTFKITASTNQEIDSFGQELLQFQESNPASLDRLVLLSTSDSKVNGQRSNVIPSSRAEDPSKGRRRSEGRVEFMAMSSGPSADSQRLHSNVPLASTNQVLPSSDDSLPFQPDQDSNVHQREALEPIAMEIAENEDEAIAIATQSCYDHLYEKKSNHRTAEDFRANSEQLVSGEPSVYLLKSKEKTTFNKELRWFEIGKAPECEAAEKKPYKVLILMGATGSGKSSLINGMANYILGVEWSDNFRFRIVNETDRSQAHSQTSAVTAYTIHPMEGMRIKNGITLIDTPGYGDTRGVEQDQEITRIIGRFLTHAETRLNFDYINAVCFVASSAESRLTPTQKYILDSVVSIFGRDVINSLRLLVTFSDGMIPPVLQAIRAAEVPGLCQDPNGDILHHKFNNSALFARNQGTEEELCFDRAFWDLGWANFNNFFYLLAELPPQSLQQTRGVVDCRTKLEKSLKDIEEQLDLNLEQIENIERFRTQISHCGHKMEDSFVEETRRVAFKVPCRKYSLNCPQCKQSCVKNVQWLKSFLPRSCPNYSCYCSASSHEYQEYEWQWRMETVKVLLTDKFEEYQQIAGRKLSMEDMLQKSQDQLKGIQNKILLILGNMADNVKSLEKSSLKSNKTTAADYLQMMKSRVELEKRPGYSTRVNTLQQLLNIVSTNRDDGSRPNNSSEKGCQTRSSYRRD